MHNLVSQYCIFLNALNSVLLHTIGVFSLPPVRSQDILLTLRVSNLRSMHHEIERLAETV